MPIAHSTKTRNRVDARSEEHTLGANDDADAVDGGEEPAERRHIEIRSLRIGK